MYVFVEAFSMYVGILWECIRKIGEALPDLFGEPGGDQLAWPD